MSDLSRVLTRWLIFSLLLGLPVLRMLLRADYGLINPEALVAAGLMAALALIPAAITRNRWMMYAVTVAIIVVMSANAIKNDFVPDMRFPGILAGLFVGVGAAVVLLRDNFYKILLIFLAGTFLVDIGNSVTKRFAKPPSELAATGARHNHVVHIIFDEMLGLGAMPPECSSCAVARDQIEETLRRLNFRIYPNAFSNYQYTRDSIPSILNDRLIDHSGQFVPNKSGQPFLHENLYFDRLLAKKYVVRAYQSDWILFKSPEYSAISAETYDVNALEALHSMDLSWWARLRQILVVYLRSDQMCFRIASMVLPPRMVELQRVGPLALAKVWPSRILNDYRTATKDTLFLAHLLTPHHPYIYKPDGSLRRPEEWSDHDELALFDDTERPLYQKRYELYGEQMQFLSHQLANFLDGLQATGQFESSTVILHGDHGSRLRLLRAAEREDRRKLQNAPGSPRFSRYDYASEPWERDLLDRYATFLAIKLPGAAAPEIVPEKGSVLHFLRMDARMSDRNPDEPGINSVYLFGEGGHPREIPILKYWQSVR